MSQPNWPAELPNIPFGVTNDGSIPNLVNQTEDAIRSSTGVIATELRASPGWNNATAAVWGGLRRGTPGTQVPLPLAIIEAIVKKLFNLPGVFFTDISNALTSLEQRANNLLLMLGAPDLSSNFNLLTAAENALKNVFTPAGALTTFTQIPPHLFGNLLPGNVSANLLPDPGFDDPTGLDGKGLWTWSSDGRTKPGSVWTTMSGVQRQLLLVPVPAPAGDVVNLAAYAKWTGVIATAGTAIALACNAYDKNDDLISDPARIVAAIATPGTNSSTFAGHDAGGWVPMSGTYHTPAGTAYIRMCLEVENNLAAGAVGFDDDLLQLTNGVVDAGILRNIESIPQLLPSSVKGFQGLTDMVATFSHLFDGLASGFSLETVVGATPSQTFSLAGVVAQLATDAHALATLAQQVLGVRTNKATSAGANPTSEAMISLPHFNSGGTLTTTSLTAGNAFGQPFRAGQDATKGFVEFIAGGNSLTNIFVNVFHVDPTTHSKALLWGSSDISVTMPSTPNFVKALIPSVSQPSVAASDNLLIEIVNTGVNPLIVATTNTGLPNHPADWPPNKGTTRATSSTGGAQPSSLTDTQVTYSPVSPYINFGIQNVPAGYMPPDRTDFSGAGSGIFPIPALWRVAGNLVDVIPLSAGGGGGSGQSFLSGQGGQPGVWNPTTLVMGVDIPLTTTSLSWTIGAGGVGGVAAFGGQNGTVGGATTVSGTGMTAVTAAGGAGGVRGGTSPAGLGAGTVTYLGVPYFGGGDVGAAQSGSEPGGGGGGGSGFGSGANGGDGFLSFTLRQP